MDILAIIFLFLLGIVLVVKGGDFFVDAASWIAEVSGIPKLIIGATIVSVATTLPEMLVSVMAAVEGKVDMAVGNAVGSVTANIGLIMALSLVFIPSVIKRKDYLAKSVLMLTASVIVVIAGFVGKINIVFSLILFAIFGLFIFENLREAKRTLDTNAENNETGLKSDKKTITVNILKFVLGATAIVIGARLLVDNGSELARIIGVSERVIGVTMVAIGTSLPELITTVTAIAKKESSLSIGNILGANIMDLSLILPLSNIISGKSIPISAMSASVDLVACLLVGLIAVTPAMIRSKFSRVQGIVLLAFYASYVILTAVIL